MNLKRFLNKSSLVLLNYNKTENRRRWTFDFSSFDGLWISSSENLVLFYILKKINNTNSKLNIHHLQSNKWGDSRFGRHNLTKINPLYIKTMYYVFAIIAFEQFVKNTRFQVQNKNNSIDIKQTNKHNLDMWGCVFGRWFRRRT